MPRSIYFAEEEVNEFTRFKVWLIPDLFLDQHRSGSKSNPIVKSKRNAPIIYRLNSQLQ